VLAGLVVTVMIGCWLLQPNNKMATKKQRKNPKIFFIDSISSYYLFFYSYICVTRLTDWLSGSGGAGETPLPLSRTFGEPTLTLSGRAAVR
jgi:hypothetical protein